MSTHTIWIESDEIPDVINIYNNASDSVIARFKRDYGTSEVVTCHIVPHGYCIANGEKTSCRCWSCSECSYGWHVSDYDRQYRYCPNCGAKVVK